MCSQVHGLREHLKIQPKSPQEEHVEFVSLLHRRDLLDQFLEKDDSRKGSRISCFLGETLVGLSDGCVMHDTSLQEALLLGSTRPVFIFQL